MHLRHGLHGHCVPASEWYQRQRRRGWRPWISQVRIAVAAWAADCRVALPSSVTEPQPEKRVIHV